MKTDDLYGYRGDDMDRVRAHIERTLNVALLPSSNQYRGDHYTYDGAGGETFVLQHNWSPLDGDLMEDAFPEATILLYVTGTSRPHVLEELLTLIGIGLVVLRREQTGGE
jgi:hypothetical protein